MKGTVYAINTHNRLVAIDTDYGFTVIELLDDDTVEVGDEMNWDDSANLGLEIFENDSDGCKIEVFVQNHYVPRHELRHELMIEKRPDRSTGGS